MDTDTLGRRVKGTLRTALVWGVAGFTIVSAVVLTLGIAGMLPDGVAWTNGLMVSIGAGIAGAAAGGAFSAVTAVLYRGQRLRAISGVRFGIVGGIVTGLFVPLFLQAMNLLSGDGLVAWALVLDDGLRMSLFGAVAAGASLKLAQRADARLGSGAQDPMAVAPPDPTDRSA